MPSADDAAAQFATAHAHVVAALPRGDSGATARDRVYAAEHDMEEWLFNNPERVRAFEPSVATGSLVRRGPQMLGKPKIWSIVSSKPSSRFSASIPCRRDDIVYMITVTTATILCSSVSILMIRY